MISQSIIRELRAVDWNFPQASEESFRSPHWYPGTFPPELPSVLIQATTRPEELVFDPYGGIGTTSTEALRLGRRAWVAELNRVAALGAYVNGAVLLLRKCHPKLLESLLISLGSCIEKLEGGSLFQGSSSSAQGSSIDELIMGLIDPSPQDLLSQVSFETSPNKSLLEPWYHKDTLQKICEFRKRLADEQSVILQLLGLMCLSACLKALSSQTRSWGHIADNVRPKVLINKNVPTGLRRWFGRFSANIGRAQIPQLGNEKNCTNTQFYVSLHDWNEDIHIEPSPSDSRRANSLITSPPYGGAIDYVLSQRLSFYLLGAEDNQLIREQRKEIGARRRRFADKTREQWARLLCGSVAKQIKFVSSHGTIVIVMPHKSEGRSNGNEIVDETLRSNGWIKALAFDRSIRAQRTRQAWTSIKRETVSIYRFSQG